MENAQELIELEIGCSGATLNRASNLDIPAVADLWMNLAEAVKTYPFVSNQSPRPPARTVALAGIQGARGRVRPDHRLEFSAVAVLLESGPRPGGGQYHGAEAL